jgi:hypothetical protein
MGSTPWFFDEIQRCPQNESERRLRRPWGLGGDTKDTIVAGVQFLQVESEDRLQAREAAQPKSDGGSAENVVR